MSGLKGQTGASTSISRPTSKKQKDDYKKHLEENYISYKSFKCPNCNNINPAPARTHDNKPYCGNCLGLLSRVVIMNPCTVSEPKIKPAKKLGKRLSKKKLKELKNNRK